MTAATPPQRRSTTQLLLLLLVLAGAYFTWQAWNELEEQRQRSLAEARTAAVNAAVGMVDDIGEEVGKLRTRAEEMVKRIDAGALTVSDAWQHMCDALDPNSSTALTIAWLPGDGEAPVTFAPGDAVYFKSAYREGGRCETYDGRYTEEEVADEAHGRISAWYDTASNTGRPAWFGEPYFSPVSQRFWCCGYSVPFLVNGRVAGVVAAELTATQANAVLFRAESKAFRDMPDDASYSMLLSREDMILSHPDAAVATARRNLDALFPGLAGMPTLAQSGHSTSDADAPADRAVSVREGVVDERSGQQLSLFHAPAGETGWRVAVVLDQSAIDRGAMLRKNVERHTVRMVLAATFVGVGVLMLLAGLLLRGRALQWFDATVFTLACLALIGWRLDYGLDHTVQASPGELVLKSQAVTAKEALHYEAQRGTAPTVIPTGVFVQSAEFSSANNVSVTGVIWQVFDKDLPADLLADAAAPAPGFVFPEAETSDLEPLYVLEEDERLVVGWKYHAVLRQEFSYERYPFDLETIWIRLWPAALGENVILAPDLAAYDTLVPEERPGLELQDFVLGGWDILDSYFSYRHNRYNTHFGTGRPTGASSHPELYFNLGLKRQFLNAFIMNFITLSVVAFLLFAVLFTIKPGDEAGELLGFNVSTVLGFCAALFFVVIISHTSLRQEIASPTLVYLEYYFFALYVAFLGVSVNAILAGSHRPPAWIRSEGNLVARLMFWPLLSATVLAVTLFVFH